MPGFKDQIALDRAVFTNVDEFGGSHKIDGVEIDITVDNDQLKHRSKVEYDGIVVGDILYFVEIEKFTQKPKPEDVQVFDGIPCIVFDVREDTGMYEIILKKNVR